MYHHFILVHSDYSNGQRIALHKWDKSIEGIKYLGEILDELNRKFPHLTFSFHHLQTDSNDWESVFEYDMFFKDVFPVNDVESFTRLITEDDKVSALDVANLITAKIDCTHLKLQKLLFFFYCEYIKQNDYPPFNEKFLAWDYGPVIREVYDKYKHYGRSNIEYKEDDTNMIIKEEPFKLSVYSRFKKTPVYSRILAALDKTLQQYGEKSANELVNISHLSGTPWDITFQNGSGRNRVIEYDLIRDFVLKRKDLV